MQKKICVLLGVAVLSLMSFVSCSKDQTIIGTEMTESYDEYFEVESTENSEIETEVETENIEIELNDTESESESEDESVVQNVVEIPQESEQETPQEPESEISQESEQETPQEPEQEASQEPESEISQESEQEASQKPEQETSQEPEQEIPQEPEQEVPQESEQETPKEEIPEDSQEETEEVTVVSSWVSQLENAQNTTQIIAVACDGSYATVSMHTKDEQGVWVEEFSVNGRIGKNGVGKIQEGDKKTPVGVFKFNMAFGVLENPGITVMPYLQVDESHHWVDDSDSQYYNQFVSTKDVEMDWDSSEHLYKVVPQYNYVLSINYNEECVPNKGSAVFLHCNSKSIRYTAGCISIPEEYMIEVMKKLKSDCIIIIDDAENITNY